MIRKLFAALFFTWSAYGAATPIANLAISTDANGRGNSWTNLADVVLTNGVRLSTVSGGSGTFTNVTIGTNVMTAQAIIQVESNIVLRASGGINYFGLASTLAGAFTFNGSINANDNIEIANTKHLRFQDGGGTNTVHLAATAGRLVITGAVDIVSGHAVPATINGSPIATGTPLYVQSETNANARLASNFWAAADSTTNYLSGMGGLVWNSPYGGPLIGNIAFTNTDTSSSAAISAGANNTLVRWTVPDGNLGLYYQLWDSGNDGSGSGLDADTLDGVNSSDFVLTTGSGSGLTNLNSGSLTNLGAGLAISGGKLTVTNTPAPLPAQTAPFALEIISRHDVHGTNLTAFYARGADAVLSLSSVTTTNAVNFEGVANQSTATIVTPTYVIYNVRVPALATNFTRLRWRAIDNQATANQPTLVMSWNNAASFATMTSVVSAVSTATSNGYSIAGWTNGSQGRNVQIIAAFTAASTNNLNTRFQGFEASQAQPLFTVEP